MLDTAFAQVTTGPLMYIATRLGRIALVSMLLALLGAAVLSYFYFPKSNPSDWYFYTLDTPYTNYQLAEKGDVYVQREIMPQLPFPAYGQMFVEFRKRCDLATRTLVNPIGAEWRGVTLCNSANLTGQKFDEAHKVFRIMVDADYRNHYQEIVLSVASKVVGCVLAWGLLMGTVFLGRWISRGA